MPRGKFQEPRRQVGSLLDPISPKQLDSGLALGTCPLALRYNGNLPILVEIDRLMSVPTSPLPSPRTKPELLAPAGDRDCLRAAIENGADAVYFGLATGFNARARATNFTLDDLPEMMALLHQRGVKGYVTLNTLVFPSELPAL